MSLLTDEIMAPALGFTAPNRAYPLVTHLRGVAGHLVFGLAVAAVTEAAWAFVGSESQYHGQRHPNLLVAPSNTR